MRARLQPRRSTVPSRRDPIGRNVPRVDVGEPAPGRVELRVEERDEPAGLGVREEETIEAFDHLGRRRCAREGLHEGVDRGHQEAGRRPLPRDVGDDEGEAFASQAGSSRRSRRPPRSRDGSRQPRRSPAPRGGRLGKRLCWISRATCRSRSWRCFSSRTRCRRAFSSAATRVPGQCLGDLPILLRERHPGRALSDRQNARRAPSGGEGHDQSQPSRLQPVAQRAVGQIGHRGRPGEALEGGTRVFGGNRRALAVAPQAAPAGEREPSRSAEVNGATRDDEVTHHGGQDEVQDVLLPPYPPRGLG